MMFYVFGLWCHNLRVWNKKQPLYHQPLHGSWRNDCFLLWTRIVYKWLWYLYPNDTDGCLWWGWVTPLI